MKQVIMGLLFTVSLGASASETCYQLSAKAGQFSRTPEVMCVNLADKGAAKITLKTGLMPKTIAVFNLDYLQGVKCLNCNQNLYGISNPSNSVFNELRVQFDGTYDPTAKEETGTVKIGENLFYYRSLK